MKQENIVVSSNRPATPDELYFAYQTLLSFGDTIGANSVKNFEALEMDDHQPLVVTDFSSIGDHKILLVPDGVHAVSRQALDSCSYIIGLPPKSSVQPTLMFADGMNRPIISDDFETTTNLAVYSVVDADRKLTHVERMC